MGEIWGKIDAWLAVHAPQVLATLNAGATDAQIAEAEATLAIQFPEDMKAAYRIHNGQANNDYGLMDGREFLSLARIVDEWQVWKELLDDGTFQTDEGEDQGCAPALGIRNVWWSAQWIPLTYDGSGNHDCLDMSPAEGGTVGQIITMWHDDPIREIVAPSFQAWLQQYALGLASGLLVFSEDYGGIVNAEDASLG